MVRVIGEIVCGVLNEAATELRAEEWAGRKSLSDILGQDGQPGFL